MLLVTIHTLDADGLSRAQNLVTREHYLRKPVDQRCMPEGYAVHPRSIARRVRRTQAALALAEAGS